MWSCVPLSLPFYVILSYSSTSNTGRRFGRYERQSVWEMAGVSDGQWVMASVSDGQYEKHENAWFLYRPFWPLWEFGRFESFTGQNSHTSHLFGRYEKRQKPQLPYRPAGMTGTTVLRFLKIIIQQIRFFMFVVSSKHIFHFEFKAKKSITKRTERKKMHKCFCCCLLWRLALAFLINDYENIFKISIQQITLCTRYAHLCISPLTFACHNHWLV